MKIGFTSLLFLLFLGLKLGGLITWSWIWVTAPLWIIPLFFLTIFTVLGAAVTAKVIKDV